MSPRAAWRLESFGFTRVYDYEAGKSDWTASGLPTEGRYARMPRPGLLAREVPTCRLDDRIGEVRKRIENDRATMCIVTTDDGVVLGRVRKKELDGDDGARVSEVMEDGPTTVRFDEFLPDLTERMKKAGVGTILVTTPAGRLVGVMHRKDSEKLLRELQAAHDHSHDGHDHDHA